jgi:cytochrome c oxidase assembly protein subunit 15
VLRKLDNNLVYNPILHRLSLATAILTFPLIFIGGMVTSKHAGMSVPDWPNTWGYNMFTFPPSKWVGGIFYEHTHRLYASGIGFLTIVIVAAAFGTDRRKSVRWGSVGLLAAVLAQGIIGGLRVVKSDLDLAIVHGCAAQIFFCLVASYCVLTSPLLAQPPQIDPAQLRALRRILRISFLATLVALVQLIIGAIMRHSGAGLAIPDFPTSFGGLAPPLHIDNEFRAAAIHRYGADLGLNQITAFQIWIHFSHRIGAVCVTAVIVWLCVTIIRQLRGLAALRRPAMILPMLVALQITLGILTVLMRKPADIASSHVAVGALVLMTTWVIVVRCYVLVRPNATGPRVISHGAEPTSDARSAIIRA